MYCLFKLNFNIVLQYTYRYCSSHILFQCWAYRRSTECTAVGIASRYGLNGLGIGSRWGRDFLLPSIPVLGPPGLLYNGRRVCFPGVKRPGRGVDHPCLSSAKVNERFQLYVYFSSRVFVACFRVAFTFIFMEPKLRSAIRTCDIVRRWIITNVICMCRHIGKYTENNNANYCNFAGRDVL
jgi:hypothetical protein